MSNCCPGSHPKPDTQACPQCGIACKNVEMPTLYHQVRFPENQGINPDTYYFCPAKGCAIGYFSIAGKNIPKRQLRTYQEIQEDALCYCFDIDASEYLAGINTNDAEAIKNFVMHRTKSGECACELRNPSGQCCLARFKHLEKEYNK